jgi:hypothetical protein
MSLADFEAGEEYTLTFAACSQGKVLASFENPKF